MLRTTMACTFSTSNGNRIVTKRPEPMVWLNMFTRKRAWRHNGVHFFRHLNFQKCSDADSSFTFFTSKCASHQKGFPQDVRNYGALYILTSKHVSRHNRVHFFDISTSKSSGRYSSSHFSLPNVFRATTECTFLTSEIQKVPRS